MLTHHFLGRYAHGAQTQVSAAAMKSLLQYDWPGNVRELENCVARAVALGERYEPLTFPDLATRHSRRAIGDLQQHRAGRRGAFDDRVSRNGRA